MAHSKTTWWHKRRSFLLFPLDLSKARVDQVAKHNKFVRELVDRVGTSGVGTNGPV